MNEEPWILKDNLRQIFHQAISAIMPSYTPGSEKYLKLLSLPLKEPVKHMQVALPHSIETVCDDFLTNYDDGSMEIPSQKLSHKNWGEREEVLRDIAVRILDTLILIVDLSLLFNSVTHESDESSSTMSSPPPN
ncbi:5238_t:CDS:2 [Entrophospora sp. SA101]|nr:5238_t:CDS:2 [Entrophospora sp. SA101]